MSFPRSLLLLCAAVGCAGSLVRAATVDPASGNAQPFPGTPVSGYTLAWSDEFNGTTLDTAKWNYRTDSRHWSTQFPANVTLGGGTLRLNLKKETANGMAYTGGGVISKAAMRYGYYEARMKTPPGAGWHSSFWMMKYDTSGGTGTAATAIELDAIENDSISPLKYGVNTHRWNPTPHVTYGSKTATTPSLNAAFHVIGCEFTAETVKYFFDGALVQTVDATQFAHSDVNVWLTSIASYLGGTTAVDDTQLPATAQYDYVRFFAPINAGPQPVTWTTPSADARGSMPLGNGDVALNAWVESSGDLLFYIGKSDAWEDNSRLAKLGLVRVKLTPTLLPAGATFSQSLDPARGEMVVTVTPSGGSPTTVRLWADANRPVVVVNVDAPSAVAAAASFELWRTAATALPSIEASDVNYNTAKANNMEQPTVVEADTVLTGITDGVGWYHRNAKSVGPNETMSFQDLASAPWSDPILGRTFGAFMRASGATRTNDQTLTRPAATSHRFEIHVLTQQPATGAEWLTTIRAQAAAVEAVAYATRRAEHLAWWADFWDRSYIDISARDGASDPTAATDVTRGYALQRFITACAGRGQYPIKFNGSLFTVPWPGKAGDADYRRWGPGYWWQNTRLPYAALCTSGDFDLLPSLHRMYLEQVLPVARYRTSRYFGFSDAAYLTEVHYPWGAVLPTSYGWTTPAAQRSFGDGKLQTGQYHKREWVGGLELSAMLLDYYEHTGDANFLTQKLLPAVLPLLRFFDRYYATGADGKLVMNPSQALETWWTCTNPMPEIAGLRAVIPRLLGLPADLLSATDRSYLTTLLAKVPALPTRTVSGTTMLAAAQSFSNKQNVENPELYAVFPFRLVSFEKANAPLGVAALDARTDSGAFGWRQDDIFMAYLGLANQARGALVSRARDYDTGCRFPAFWGPNYDWTPDQCHGGVLMKTAQAMLLQSEGDRIFLLPAWPADWNASFKLHAPKQTTIEAVVRDGALVWLNVTPALRRADVVLPAGFSDPNAPSVTITSPAVPAVAIADLATTLRLTAAVVDAGGNGTTTIAWSVVSGPGTVTFADATAADTSAHFAAAGVYVLQCVAANAAGTGSASITVSVNAPLVITLREGVNGYAHAATTIRADHPDWNAGARDLLLVGRNSGAMRALFSFDLTSLPANATVTSARLDLWTASIAGSGTVGALELRQLTASPVEGTGIGDGTSSNNGTGTGSTWLLRTATSAWTAAGGDFATPVLSSLAGYDATLTGVARTLPTTPAFIAALQNAASAGQPLDLILSATNEAAGSSYFTRIASDDATTASTRPQLTIELTGSSLPVISPGAVPLAFAGVPAALGGSVTDATEVLWSLISGPGAATFGDPTAATTSVSFPQPGSYILRLSASNASGQISRDLPVNVAPPGPANLTAVATTSDAVLLTWIDGTNTEAGFVIERMAVADGIWIAIITTGPNVTSIRDFTALPTASYLYRIKAVNADGSTSPLAFSPGVTVPASTSHSPLVILPLGDSITQGAGAAGGYRDPLRTLLASRGWSIQYAGSRTDNATGTLTSAGQTHHEGHGSYSSDLLLGNLDGLLPPYAAPYGTPPDTNGGGFWITGTAGRAAVFPDVILLMIGTNDLGMFQHTPAQTRDYYDALLTRLATLRQNALIVCSTLLPYSGDPFPPGKDYSHRESDGVAFNALLVDLVAAHQAAGHRVALHDMRAQVSLANASSLIGADGVHPTPAGYNAVAAGWFDALKKIPMIEAWRVANFGTVAATGSSADDADPDGDGLQNLVEYGIGSNPLQAASGLAALQSKVITDLGSEYLSLTFPRRKNSSLRYLAEVSPDLVNWNSATVQVGAPISPPGLDSAFEQVTFRDGLPRAASAQRFIRLRVMQP